MKPFDLEAAKNGAAVVTRDGHKARIICFDRVNDRFPLVALVTGDDGCEYFDSYTSSGKCSIADSDDDDSGLLMAPTKKECWINFYGEGNAGMAYKSKEIADKGAGVFRISCIHHTWEE